MMNPFNSMRATSVKCPLHARLCAIFTFALTTTLIQPPPASAQMRLPPRNGRLPVLGQLASTLAPVERVLVKLQPGLSPEDLLRNYAVARAAARTQRGVAPDAIRAAAPDSVAPALVYVRSNPATGWHVLSLRNTTDLSTVLLDIKKMPGVLSVQPDYRARLLNAPPKEPYYGVQNWQDQIGRAHV